MPRTRRKPQGAQAIAITTMPSLAQVRDLWEGMQAGRDTDLFHTDWSATTFDGFVQNLGKGTLLLLGTVGGVVAGGAWLSHERALPVTREPHYSFVDIYLLPPFRGPVALRLCQAWRTYILETMGFAQFYGSVRLGNRPCQQLMGALGMYRCGVVPKFLAVHGTLEDVILYAAFPPIIEKGDKDG